MKVFILCCLLLGWTEAASLGEAVVTTYQRSEVPVPFEKYGPPPPGAPQPGFVPVVQTAYGYDIPEAHLTEHEVIVPTTVEVAAPAPQAVGEAFPVRSTVVIEETKPAVQGQSVSVHTEESYSFKTPEAPFQSGVQEIFQTEGKEKVQEEQQTFEAQSKGDGASAVGPVVESYSYDLPDQHVEEQHYSYSTGDSGKVQASTVSVSSRNGVENYNEKVVVEQPVSKFVEQSVSKLVYDQPATNVAAGQPISSGQIVETSYAYELPEYISHPPVHPVPSEVVVTPHKEVHTELTELVAPQHIPSGEIIQSYTYDVPHGPAEAYVAPHNEIHTEVTEVVGPQQTGEIIQSYTYEGQHGPAEVFVAPQNTVYTGVVGQEHIPSGEIIQSYSYEVPHSPVEVIGAPHSEIHTELVAPAHIPSGEIVQSYTYEAPQGPAEVFVAPHNEIHTEVVGPQHIPSGQIIQSYSYDVPHHPVEFIGPPHNEIHTELVAPAHIPSGEIIQSYTYEGPHGPAEAFVAPHNEIHTEVTEVVGPQQTGEIIQSYTYEAPHGPAEAFVAPHNEIHTEGFGSQHIPSGEIIQSYSYDVPHAPAYPSVPPAAVASSEFFVASHQDDVHAGISEVVAPPSVITPQSYPPLPYNLHLSEFHGHAAYLNGNHHNCFGAGLPFFPPGGPIHHAPFPAQPAGHFQFPAPQPPVVVEQHGPFPPPAFEHPLYHPTGQVIVQQPHAPALIEQPVYHPPGQVIVEQPHPPAFIEQSVYHPPAQVIVEQPHPPAFIEQPVYHPSGQVIVEQPHPPTQVVVEDSKPYPPAGVVIEDAHQAVQEVIAAVKPYPPALPVVVEQHGYQPPSPVVVEHVAPFVQQPHEEGLVVDKFGPYPPTVAVEEVKTYPYPPAVAVEEEKTYPYPPANY